MYKLYRNKKCHHRRKFEDYKEYKQKEEIG